MEQASSRQLVFVGLGNPGKEYALTRHNMGYLVLQAWARQLGWHFKEEKRLNVWVAKGSKDGVNLHLLLPTTYMNVSGLAVRRYLDFFKLSSAEVIVVVDDIATPFGEMRLRLKGSAGGHNGLKSIETHLGTSNYVRLRMGIGHPGQAELVDYVLDPFSQTELEQLPAIVDRGVGVLEHLLKETVEQVMNKVNTTPRQQPSAKIVEKLQEGLEKNKRLNKLPFEG